MQAALVQQLHEGVPTTSRAVQRAPILHDALEVCGAAVPVVKPCGAAVPVQDPSTQQSPGAQIVPHAPQLKGSALSSVHMPPQTDPEHAPQEPSTHDSLGAHFFPQAPQLKGSALMSGQ
jgi:hypothetical protein